MNIPKTNLASLLTHSMMTPMERAKGRFMRAPDHDGGSGGGKTFTKDELDAAIEKAVGPLKESVDGSSAPSATSSIAEKAQASARAEIKPEDLTAAEERADKAEAALAEAQKSVKTLTTERDKAVKALETESAFTQQLLIADGIKSALIANGVKDEDYLDTLSARFAKDAKVVVDGETRKAMIGDKPLADHFKEWAGSDAGKKFVEAPANSGGGAGGGKGGESGKTMLRSAFDALPPAEQQAFVVKDGGKVVDQAA
jgi:hypothetical protein